MNENPQISVRCTTCSQTYYVGDPMPASCARCGRDTLEWERRPLKSAVSAMQSPLPNIGRTQTIECPCGWETDDRAMKFCPCCGTPVPELWWKTFEEKGATIRIPDGPGPVMGYTVPGAMTVEQHPREITKHLIGMPDYLKPAVTPESPEAAEDLRDITAQCLVIQEVLRARGKHPEWPTDVLHAFAVISEEYGEAAKEALQLVYEPTLGGCNRLRTEVVQLAATCHRFLVSIEKYEFKPSKQHKQ